MLKAIDYYNEHLSLQKIKKHTFYGRYRGFEVTLYTGSFASCYINFYLSYDIKVLINTEIIKKNTNPFIRYSLDDLGCHISCGDWTRKKAAIIMCENIDAIIDILEREHLSGDKCCAGGYDYDGTETVKIINKRYALMGHKGMDLIKYHQEDRKKMIDAIPNRYFRGALGLLIGTILAAIIWITTECLGFYSPISCAFAAIIGDFLYINFGGKDNYIKLIMMSVLSIVILLLTTFTTYVVMAHIQIAKEALDITPIEYIFNDYSFSFHFVSIMIENLIFTLIGIAIKGAELYDKYRESHIRVSDMPEAKDKKAEKEIA